MRLLVVSPFLPHDEVAHGGGVYLRALLGALADQAEVGLVCFADQAETEAQCRISAGLRRLDVVTLPRLGELAGWPRARHRLAACARWALQRTPLAAAKFESPTMRSVLRRAVRDFEPDACLVEFALMAPYLTELSGSRTVFTDHEACVAIPASVGPGGFGAGRDARLWERLFDRFYPLADRLQALNEPDARVLGERFGREVAVRPPTVAIPRAAVDAGAAPPRALFLGDYAHHPNPEAARFLVREVWPRVRQTAPDAELWLAGPHGGEALEALGREPGVRWVGFVPDLPGLLGSVRLVLAPVLSGRGSRIKVLTALAAGLPVVANSLGAQGVGAGGVGPEGAEDLAAALALAEDPVGLADLTLTWLQDSAAAREAGQAARRWAAASLDPSAVARWQVENLGSGPG